MARSVVAVVAVATLVAPAAAVASSVEGVDVSRWQHGAPLDWGKVRGDGMSFAFVKATEGVSYTNPYYAADVAATRTLGLYRGAYHFARPSVGSARAQARYFVQVAGRHDGRGDLPPVLDLEVTGGLSVAALRTWTRIWLSEVEELTGRVPVIYTSPAFWEANLGNSTAFTRYPLWVAHYTSAPDPRVPGGWPAWTFWQYTSSGRVAGVGGNVDVNRFAGGPRALAQLAQDTPAPAPGPGSGPGEEVVPGPVAETTLQVAGLPRRVFAGRKLTVTGRLQPVRRGRDGAVTRGADRSVVADPVRVGARVVSVWHKPTGGKRFVRVAATRTDVFGGYRVPVRVTGAGAYRVRFAGSDRYAPVQRTSRVELRLLTTSTRLAVPKPLRITAGVVDGSELSADPVVEAAGAGWVRLSGRVVGEFGKGLVKVPVRVLSRSKKGTWRPLAQVRTKSGGVFSVVVPAGAAGYVAVFPGSGTHAADPSRVVS